MKKLISLLSAITISSISTINVISCGSNSNTVLNSGQINAAANLAESAIVSQHSTYNLSADDVLNSLEESNSSLTKNINGLFENEGSGSDFSLNSKVNFQINSDEIHKYNSLFPQISNPVTPGEPINIETALQMLPVILQLSGSVILPMIMQIIDKGYDNEEILETIFSSDILSSNGGLLKETIGSVSDDGKWVISDSKFSNMTYKDVLTEVFSNFKDSFENIYKIIKNKQPISNLQKQDVKNVTEAILVLTNYLSQFNFAKTDGNYSKNEQILYTNDAGTMPDSNEGYKGSVLSKKFEALKQSNFSQLFTNFEEADTNKGLGYQQLLFTVFGSSKLGNATLTFNNLPMGMLIEDIIGVLLPEYQPQISLFSGILGMLMSTISSNQDLNVFIDLLNVSTLAMTGNVKKDINLFVQGVKNNPNWYSDETGGGVGGTTWSDLWVGKDKSSLLKVILSSFQDVLPSSLQDLSVDNISEIYKILENKNIKIKLNTDGNAPDTSDDNYQNELLSLKDIFTAFDNKNKLFETLLSPIFFKMVENLENGLQNKGFIDEAKKDYQAMLANWHVSDPKVDFSRVEKFVTKLQQEGKDNLLTYIAADSYAYFLSSKTGSEASDINTYTYNILDNILDVSSEQSAFHEFINNVSSSLSNADDTIFSNDVNNIINDKMWTLKKLTRSGSNYSFYLILDNSNNYKVDLVRDSGDIYYKISVSDIE